ncbi:unnamed protein product [Hermetia illucens]|uniref:Uncharacterized protein n=1 Tax=Hermetia illucens TaxID=343691 RepID=A0A7R8UQJ7_HERIL|nr:unnamed protein product [Hermetia illucens]
MPVEADFASANFDKNCRESSLHTHITTDWESVKALLINHFDTPEIETQLMERLLVAKFTTAGQQYTYICKCLFKINQKINYNDSYNVNQKSEFIRTKNITKNIFLHCKINIYEQMSGTYFGILHAYKSDSLEDAYKDLVNTGYLNYSNSGEQHNRNMKACGSETSGRQVYEMNENFVENLHPSKFQPRFSKAQGKRKIHPQKFKKKRKIYYHRDDGNDSAAADTTNN